MEQIKTKIKKWGNSFGVVIPKEVINSKGIRENSDVSITIETEDKMTVGDVLNITGKLNLKRKGDTQKILEKIDEEFEGV